MQQLFCSLFDHHPNATGAWYQLEAAYKHRPYHNLHHIERMINASYDYVSDRHVRRLMQVAIFYHDAIYDPTSKLNEVNSACLAMKINKQLGSQWDSQQIASMIIDTQHDLPVIGYRGQVICDLDLMGLADPREIYTATTAKIRREFGVFTDEQWRAGRRKFLEMMLDKDRIFYLLDLDDRARANLKQDLSEL